MVEGAVTKAPLAYVGAALTNVKIPKIKPKLAFGGNGNSTYHTFRHTFDSGYSIGEIKRAVSSSMKPLVNSEFPTGVKFIGSFSIDGININYNAWRFAGGKWNIGSIKPPRK